jgi:hypothetical protein
MKVKTVLVAALAGGVGYVLGTRAGRERFEELKARANDLAHSPQAQEAAAKVAAEVKKSTGSLPDPVANVINNAADAVAGAPKPDTTPGTTPVAPA